MAVNAKHADYTRMIDRWARCRDVTEGQDAVHTAGEKYLPRLKDQDNVAYAAYVMRTPFYNATWRTVAGLVGMVFRKEPVIEVPEKTKPLLEDVTLTGMPFTLFAQEVMEEALKLGRLGVLCDYPQVEAKSLTLADSQRLNLRPTLAMYKAESIINWRLDKVNNAWRVVQVVLKECHDIIVDEFTVKSENRYRVLDLLNGVYRQRIYRLTADGKDEQIGADVFPTKRGATMDYIPFTFVSTDDTTAEVDEPPLIDLVNVNLSHYRTSADLEHGAHFTGLPTPYVCGATMENPNDKLYIGSTSAWVFKAPETKVGFLEFTGTGLKALSDLLEAKEKRMAVLGARMLEQQKKAVESAETSSIHRKGEESMLSSAAIAVSLGLTQALKWFVDWADGADTKDVKCELNRNFYPMQMTPQMLTALVDAWQKGGISFETLFDNLQAAEVQDEEATVDEEQARIGDTPPALQGQNVDPVTGEPAAPTKLPKPRIKPRSTTIKSSKGDEYTVTHND